MAMLAITADELPEVLQDAARKEYLDWSELTPWVAVLCSLLKE